LTSSAPKPDTGVDALSPAVGHRNLIAIDIQIGERDDPV
jgi:hypothetical protein